MRFGSFLRLLLLLGPLSGCGTPSYGEIEVRGNAGVATLPVTLWYLRRGEQGCDTNGKINPCSDTFERLTFVSASCGSPDCTVEKMPGQTLRFLATRGGTYTVHLEVRGDDSNETVAKDFPVEILSPSEVEVKIAAKVTDPALEGHLYDALPEGGGAWLDVSLVERGRERSFAFDPKIVRWSVEGAETFEHQDELTSERLTGIRNARAGQAVVTARLTDDLYGEARFDVLTPDETMPVHVSTAQWRFEDEPTLVEVHSEDSSEWFFTALVDARGRRIPGGADLLRVEGQGCTLVRTADPVYLNAETSIRVLEIARGARCSLRVTDIDGERAIAVSRPAS